LLKKLDEAKIKCEKIEKEKQEELAKKLAMAFIKELDKHDNL
jgi:hypothetical protein